MRCPRCKGCLYKEPTSHRMQHIADPGPGWMWACVNCGNRVDAQMLQNRMIQEAERVAKDAFEARHER